MTATMAAKDTNQLTRNKATCSTNNNNNNNNSTTIHRYPLRRQAFHQPPAATPPAPAPFTASTFTIPTPMSTTTTTAQQQMARAINIGFTGYTHAYLQHQCAGNVEINERVQRNEMTGARVATAPSAAAVDNEIDVVDDDEGNVDGNANMYRDSVAAMATNIAAAVVVVDDVNFAVDTRSGVAMVADDDGDDSDSFASMETLSDNVAVWVDGEKHWVAGVDANTTCADLICALLNYQNAQQLEQKQYNHHHHQQQHQQYLFNVNSAKNNNNNKNIHNNNNIKATKSSSSSSPTANTAINQSTLIKTSTYTKENCDPLLAASIELTVGGCYPAATASSMALTVPATSNGISIGDSRLAQASEYVIVKQHRHCEEYLDGKARVFDVLPANDGPSKKECELLLRRLAATNSNANNSNNNTTTFTAMPAALHRSTSPSFNLNTQVSSLLSTDKDSGMGSPVGSSRSARLRRRKYKSAATVSWLAQANTLHPRVSQRAVTAFSGFGHTLTNAHADGVKHMAVIEQALGEDGLAADALDGLGGGVSANERLLKIILAQDETIHRQLVLLREKERQISKIEEEKHRVRERELGKNYLLETYLNGLDDGNVEPDLEVGTDVGLADCPLNEFNEAHIADIAGGEYGVDDVNGNVEIYIDEPYHRTAKTTDRPHTTTVPTTTATKKDIVAGKTRDFNLDARHSKKMKEDFTGGGDVAMCTEKDITNEPPAAACHGNEKEIDMQLIWLEKIYALNKQLQREEEMLLRLHAKIRKHQVKRAYQTKREVLQQIEKLDAELTLQCCDIRTVESKLHASNEQLKQKLGVLERLSQEFLETMDTSPAESAEQQLEVVTDDTADSQTIVNRMPVIINNADHNLAKLLHATTEMARENKLEVASELHAKHSVTAITEQLVVQQGCQLQQVYGEPEDMWRMQDAKLHLPHAKQSTSQALEDGDLNVVDELKKPEVERNIAKVITKTTTTDCTALYSTITKRATATTATTTATRETTNISNAMAASHASAVTSNLTATSCAAPPSTARMAQTTAATATTINATSSATAAASACNMSAVSPAEGKQTAALHLPQLQQQQQQQTMQQEQMPLLPPEDDNSHQCVDADDVLVDVRPAVGAAVLPHSNYPISCINRAAVHATNQLTTRKIIVATSGGDDVGGDCGGGGLAAAVGKLTPEQTLPSAVATLPAAYLTTPSLSSSSTTNISFIQQQQQQQAQLAAQQQQQQYPPQLLPQRQHINMNSYLTSNCIGNHTNNINNKNLLPPSHVAHTKTLQKQMFSPKSLNQMLPAVTPPKIALASTATMTTPSNSIATMPIDVCARAGYDDKPPTLATLRPTTPTALFDSPAIPLDVATQRSGIDITHLGTLV